ncbi:diadenosine tetraphosphatase [Amylibacter sp. SFDW26]|uniref:metallophosphoesterase family protein n=1 Tax=Amylibacter sp. SFDW26 TaxID=2652722 RepID=UPI001262663A|nr:metallophosphoesterase family protein [Amylibacter sp. SFDW26]KAB7615613.1 diadenosine tetraphosphatase [Amylibacter sp. SFDW26]
MKIQDLGEIHGDMLLFGGVYSNLHALDAFLDVANMNNIAPQNIICSGDVVAYCADARACCDKMRSLKSPVLAGNCEIQLAANALDCGCGYDEGSECSLLSRGWYAHATDQVSTENKSWMGGLPDRILFIHNTKKYVVIHGGALDVSRFIWPVTSDDVIIREIELLAEQVGPIDHVIAGHSGIPMQRIVKGVQWTNSGAIGMPSHNGKPQTHYALLGKNGIEIKELEYNFTAASIAMEQVGLVQGYHETLKTGYWPSEDTLPSEMHL